MSDFDINEINISIGNPESSFWEPFDKVHELPPNTTWEEISKRFNVSAPWCGKVKNGWHEFVSGNSNVFVWCDNGPTDLSICLKGKKSAILDAIRKDLGQ